ncbi:MAG: DUF1318 domain-containing protein [Candidatus Omnitrophota bacterium]|jgi:uncharacterized protein YdbL (DUF1318 family)
MSIPKVNPVRPAFQIGLTFFVLLGCARVSIDTKKPIQVDVKMRVDIYQHVAQDVASIEDMISSEPKAKGAEQVSLFLLGVKEAWAQVETDYPQDVRAAIERRKARRSELISWEAKGVIGENMRGQVELVNRAAADNSVAGLVEQENRDRSTIYAYVAGKNNASVDETARISAKRIQEDAPSGTPIQSPGGEWTTK